MLDALRLLQVGEPLLEPVRVDPVHDLAEHLEQTPVRVEGEALVARRAGETLRGRVVEPEVEDRVHHPRHRDGGARANGDEQGIGGVAEPLARLLLQRAEVLVELLAEPVGKLLAVRSIGAAGVRRDRESGRNRHAHLRHLREPGPLPAE